MTEIEIWRLLRKGDNNAFQEIYNKYANLMYNYGMKVVNNPTMVEDAIQSVFLNIYRLRENITTPQSVKAYLLTALKRQLLFERKKEMRRLESRGINQDLSLTHDKYIFYAEVDYETTVINNENREELIQKVDNAIAKLTPRQKEALYLKYNQELSGEEIATIMNINHQSVRNMINEIMKGLRDDLTIHQKLNASLVMSMLICCCLINNI